MQRFERSVTISGPEGFRYRDFNRFYNPQTRYVADWISHDGLVEQRQIKLSDRSATEVPSTGQNRAIH